MQGLLDSSDTFDKKSTKLFVSSDTAEGVQLMLKAFPGHVVAQRDSAYSRNSLEGLQAGALDLFMLTEVDQIVCTSLASSFAVIANDIRQAKTGQKPKDIIYLPALKSASLVPTDNRPPLNFVIIPMGGFANKLRSVAKMFGFAKEVLPWSRKEYVFVHSLCG